MMVYLGRNPTTAVGQHPCPTYDIAVILLWQPRPRGHGKKLPFLGLVTLALD